MATDYNAAYTIDGATNTPAYGAFGTEVVLKREWTNIWLRKMPLLAMIYDGKANWNNGSNVNGTRILIPVMIAQMTTVADGVADASELTPITPHGTDGFSQAMYEISHYQGATYITASEMRLINNARGDFKGGKMKQAMDSFSNAIADDLCGTSADARANVVGIQQVIATSNTVGGIAQGTYTDWAGLLQTGAGAFVLDLISDRADLVSARGGKSKLGLFSSTSTNNVWGKLKAAIGAAERITNNDFKKKYGITNIEYEDITCVMENRITGTGATDGRFYLLDTDHWYFRGDETPNLYPKQRLEGTGADEYYFDQFLAIGCGDAGKQAGVQGITA